MTTPPSCSAANRAIIFDAETNSKNNPKVIETAYMYLDPQSLEPQCEPVVQRFDPGAPLDFGAIAVHHILPQELVGLPGSDSFSLPEDVGYVIGHKIGFDLGAIGNPKVKAIDTLALAQKAWPDLDSHTQSALYYMIMFRRDGDVYAARDLVKNAHSAGTDIQICATILAELRLAYEHHIEALPDKIGVSNLSLLESLHLISEAAKLPLKMTFGKHEGVAPWNVPADYKAWYCGVAQPDPHLVMAMKRGGNTPQGQACFNTALRVFGSEQDYSPEPEPVAPAPRQPHFKF